MKQILSIKEIVKNNILLVWNDEKKVWWSVINNCEVVINQHEDLFTYQQLTHHKEK